MKKAILNRKNALFYKTENGARVGDIFMTIIHTCELQDVNPFDYLVAVQQHTKIIEADPNRWMPWNFREALVELEQNSANPT